MRVTQPLLARGFLGRSAEELKRLSNIVLKLEAVKGVSGPRPLYDFKSDSTTSDCVLMSDDLIGGSSKSSLDFITAESPSTAPTDPNISTTSTPPSYARFHGHISTALPPNRPAIKRTGYAAFRTPEQRGTAFGRSVWDIDPYTYLALRVKSDGRAYFVNVQTETVEPTDLHQHRLFARRPGQWETVLIKWNDFVRTNYGFVVEPQTEMLRQRVRTVGIGLTDRVEGPFELCIERLWATNDLREGDVVVTAEQTTNAGADEQVGSEQSQLKNRKGEKIRW